MSRSIAPDALKVVLQHPESLTLLDVRRRGDCDADTVMLPGARWCDPEHISAWSQGLLKEKEIVLSCAHGRAVRHAAVDD
jgi:rhodanese-related sulfurtransferase